MKIHENKNKWDLLVGILLGIGTGIGITSLTAGGYVGIIPMLMMHDLSCLVISSFSTFSGVGIKACYKNNFFAELLARIFRLILVMGVVRLGTLFLMYLIEINRMGQSFPMVYSYGIEKMEPGHLMSFVPMLILFPIIMFYVRSQGMLFNYREKEFYEPEYINTKLYHKMAKGSVAAGFSSGQEVLRTIPKEKNNVQLKSRDLTSLFYGSYEEKLFKPSGIQQRESTRIFDSRAPVSFDFTEKKQSQPEATKSVSAKEQSMEKEQSTKKVQERVAEETNNESMYDREKITRKRRN